MNALVRNVLLFSDPPVLYRVVDLAGIPGDPAESLPIEIESSLPFGAEEAALAWTNLSKTEYLVAAVPRAALARTLEKLGERAASAESIVPWPLAVAAARVRGTKGRVEREVRAEGYRFRFEGARLVGAEADPAPLPGEPAPPPEAAAAACKRFSIDFGAGGRARAGSASGKAAVAAGLLILVAFGAEVWAHERRTEAARAQRDEALRAVFPGGNVAQPKERLAKRARELAARLEGLEGVLSKRTSALSILAEITQAGGGAGAADAGAPIVVKDLRILEDRMSIAGWAQTSEGAERFRDRIAGVEGISDLVGPEIRGAGQGYEFTLEAKRE